MVWQWPQFLECSLIQTGRQLYTLENALHLLTLELPDQAQELFEQPLKKAKFTCFPDLPAEIRLIIWKYLLPSRRIVNIAAYHRHWSEEPEPWERRHRYARLPITLSINHESRNFTLGLYHVFFQHKTPYLRTRGGIVVPSERALCINPKIDHLQLDWGQICCVKGTFGEIYNEAPECFDAIRNLEIQKFDLWWWANWRSHNDGIAIVDLLEMSKKTSGRGILAYFKNLKSLHLISDRRSRHYSGEDLSDMQTLTKKRLSVFYTQAMEIPEDKKGWIGMKSKPEIIFHDWRRKETRSDEAYLNEKRVPDMDDDKEDEKALFF